jgi:citrate/tricarballylate utilization protein
MFSPPHEFALNIPQILSEARIESYKQWSWPHVFARSFKEPRVALLIAVVVGLLTVVLALLRGPSRLFIRRMGPGAFYQIVPYLAIVIPAVALFSNGIGIWLRGAIRSWSESGASRQPVSRHSLLDAIGAALGLRHLQGGGPGCSYPEARPSSARRVFHSFVFWGVLSAFVSTSLAFVYQDFFHLLPPYAVASAPVIFGSIGGVLLVIGTIGLIYFKLRSERAPASERAYSLDYAFLVLLGLTALTGMLTLIFRSTTALGTLLILHLATVSALFITAPYGKFVHALYRTLALARYYAEHNPSNSVSPDLSMHEKY